MKLTRAQQASLQRLVWATEDGYAPLLATTRPGIPERRMIHPQTALALTRKGLSVRRWRIVNVDGRRVLGTAVTLTEAGRQAFEQIRSGE